MEYKSCYWIEYGLSFTPHSCRMCHLYSPKGGGNVVIKDNYFGEPLDWDEVFAFKNKIKEIHKRGGVFPNCEGCIFLETKEWEEKNQISMLILDYWTKCNSNCFYCFTAADKKHFNEAKNYDFMPILEDMIKRGIFKPDDKCVNGGHVAFGGGEPTKLKEFDKLMNIFIDMNVGIIRIHTTGIIYSKVIERGLKAGNTDILVSIDAGTKEMHRMIKRVDSYDTIWKNLKRYAHNQKNPDGVKVKYIVIPGVNDIEEEVVYWLEKAKQAGINYVMLDLEEKWFAKLKENAPNELIEFFGTAKKRAQEKGLEFALFPKAEHLIKHNAPEGI